MLEHDRYPYANLGQRYLRCHGLKNQAPEKKYLGMREDEQLITKRLSESCAKSLKASVWVISLASPGGSKTSASSFFA